MFLRFEICPSAQQFKVVDNSGMKMSPHITECHCRSMLQLWCEIECVIVGPCVLRCFCYFSERFSRNGTAEFTNSPTLNVSKTDLIEQGHGIVLPSVSIMLN